MDYDFFGEGDDRDDDYGDYGGDYGGNYSDDDKDEFDRFDDDVDERMFEQGPQFVADIHAFDRTGVGRLGTEIVGGKIGDLQKRMDREMSSPEDRFSMYVDAISRKLEGDGIVHISNTDIETMLDKIPEIKDVKYKNPTAYILGFLASRGGRSMDNVSNIIKNVVPSVKDVGVEAPDVIRYARYWNLHLT